MISFFRGCLRQKNFTCNLTCKCFWIEIYEQTRKHKHGQVGTNSKAFTCQVTKITHEHIQCTRAWFLFVFLHFCVCVFVLLYLSLSVVTSLFQINCLLSLIPVDSGCTQDTLFEVQKLQTFVFRVNVFWICHKTSQELRILSTVTLDCQVIKIVMSSGSQL